MQSDIVVMFVREVIVVLALFGKLILTCFIYQSGELK